MGKRVAIFPPTESLSLLRDSRTPLSCPAASHMPHTTPRPGPKTGDRLAPLAACINHNEPTLSAFLLTFYHPPSRRNLSFPSYHGHTSILRPWEPKPPASPRWSTRSPSLFLTVRPATY